VTGRPLAEPADPIRPAGKLVHHGLLYRDTDEFLAGTVPFVEHGLDAGQPVLVAVPGPRVELLAGALGGRAARVRFADMAEVGRNPGRIIPWILHAFIDEHPDRTVRIIGEPIWAGRSDAEYPACAQHEALINVALGDGNARILCPYDEAGLDELALTDAHRTHPVLSQRGRRWSSQSYAPYEVVAEYNRPLSQPPPEAALLPFDASTLSQVRAFVAEQAERAGMSERRLVDLQLAASELATNAVVHGGGSGVAAVWPAEGGLVCQVADEGQATVRLTGRVPPAPDALAGRGLALVNYVSDLVRLHTAETGTVVRLYLRLA
jgi:anti-sigma regulatory factor (Ser/Thr protein kinase)